METALSSVFSESVWDTSYSYTMLFLKVFRSLLSWRKGSTETRFTSECLSQHGHTRTGDVQLGCANSTSLMVWYKGGVHRLNGWETQTQDPKFLFL